MRYLPPLRLQDRYFRYIQEDIQHIFNELIYRPLFDILEIPEWELYNAIDDPLYDAIKDGQIWFEDGRFHGKFNARISKRLKEIGAVYSSDSNSWAYTGALPAEVSLGIAAAASRYEFLRTAMLSTLSDMNIASIDALSNLPDKYSQTITWMNDDFEKALKGITIPPTLTEEQQQRMAAEWANDQIKYVKDWSAENIDSLRQMVQDNAFAGRRSSAMIQAIMENYGVSHHKARFLARQETSLLMSKFHEIRYATMGITRYKWSGSMDEREREDHKELEGMICEFANPPVVNKRTAATGNPGEDFGCRCMAIPILEDE